MDLDQLIKQFMEDYQAAPLYGSYSRTLRRRVPSKGDIQKAFIENILMLAKLSDAKTKARIEDILKGFE